MEIMTPTPPNTELAEALRWKDLDTTHNVEYFLEKYGKNPSQIICDAARAHLATLRDDKGGEYVLVPKIANKAIYDAWAEVDERYQSAAEDGVSLIGHGYYHWQKMVEAALKNPSDAGGEE
jgi:hypothetical protein